MSDKPRELTVYQENDCPYISSWTGEFKDSGKQLFIEKSAYDELQSKADKLAEALGMVDHVGMCEPYDRIVSEALAEYRGEK